MVRDRKNNFRIPAFLPIEQGISREGKFKIIAVTEIMRCVCLCFGLLFEIQTGGNFKILFLFLFTILIISLQLLLSAVIHPVT